MENYSFSQYIAKKDTLDEAWPQWMGNIGQKLGFGNKSAARATSDLLPKYSPGTQPNKTAALTPNMNNRASNYFDRIQNPRVNFSSNDLKRVIGSAKNYLNSIKRIPNDINQMIASNHDNFKGYEFGIKESLNKKVGPAYWEMDKWVKWAENMIAQLPKNEWGQDDIELLTEAVKVNYRNFEKMAMAMRSLKNALNDWYQTTIDRIMYSTHSEDRKEDAIAFVNDIKLYLQEKVMPITKAVTEQLGWLIRKIQELMTLHNRPYSGLPS